MLSSFIYNTAIGEGFLSLFVNLFLLTSISVLLLLVSRKWTSPTRSFLLMCMIFGYMVIIGWNLVFFGQHQNRLCLVSLTLPALETLPSPQPMASGSGSALNHPTLIQENNPSSEKTSSTDQTSLSHFIMSGVSLAGVIWLCGSGISIGMLMANLFTLGKFMRRLTRATDHRLQALLIQVPEE